ncbi:hypothetical protein HDU98_007732 [Podochytrium sp. JEL0797]|nr:hypothetical protein HDU98_007732 [Podochytrium sp. JEL0797]
MLVTAVALLATAASTTLASQYPDVVMLSACRGVFSGNVGTQQRTDWYPTLAASKAGQQAVGAASTYHNMATNFEGYQYTLYYPDGNQLTVDIFANTNANAPGTYSGYAWNNYHSFYCYRDNGRFLYTFDGFTCTAQYYCGTSLLQ